MDYGLNWSGEDTQQFNIWSIFPLATVLQKQLQATEDNQKVAEMNFIFSTY